MQAQCKQMVRWPSNLQFPLDEVRLSGQGLHEAKPRATLTVASTE